MDHEELASPVKARPLALVAGILVLAAVTHALLVGCGGKNQTEQTSTETTPTATAAQPNTTPSDTAALANMSMEELGNKVYQERCALCHGPTGHGDGPAAAGLNPKPRNHTDGSYMNSRTDAELLQVIRNGKGGMPAWGAVLSEREIQAALKHVRSLAVPPYKG